MKWYETPLTVQCDNALKLLNQGRAEAYVKAFRRMYILMKEREKQTRCDPDMISVPAHYQGIYALLHMEQSKLRVMTDEDLSISRAGLMCKQNLAPARQALEKILREQKRRMDVYGLDSDYWE